MIHPSVNQDKAVIGRSGSPGAKLRCKLIRGSELGPALLSGIPLLFHKERLKCPGQELAIIGECVLAELVNGICLG
jgi:hypothetical protein